MSTAQACLQAIKSLKTRKLEVTALQDIWVWVVIFN
jgi:carbamoyl-phosphate synthase large subunit